MTKCGVWGKVFTSLVERSKKDKLFFDVLREGSSLVVRMKSFSETSTYA